MQASSGRGSPCVCEVVRDPYDEKTATITIVISQLAFLVDSKYDSWRLYVPSSTMQNLGRKKSTQFLRRIDQD
jgi:hypothetical protein